MGVQNWVETAISGYIWEENFHPSYEQVSSGNTKFREWVKVIYDKTKINYETLVKIFFQQIDPTDWEWQFADRWYHYSPAIYYTNDEEKSIVKKYISELENSKKFDKKIAVKIEKFKNFYEAEEYHQNFSKKNPIRYNKYKIASWREKFIENNWRNKNIDFNKKLTPLQYKVTQEWYTEIPFENEYWDNKEPGIYVDVIDGTPLFSSTNKFDSWTGWPSFSKTIDENFITEKADFSYGMLRTEVKSKNCHLWHVFNDWPIELWWKRYCINSAALRFIHKNDLEKEWYEKYIKLFQ